MCAERMQRLLTALMIFISYLLLTSANYTAFGTFLIFFIIAMIVLWAFTNFCPSIWFFEKIFGKCDWDK